MKLLRWLVGFAIVGCVYGADAAKSSPDGKADATTAAKRPPPIVMDPFVVNEQSKLSFGFSVRIYKNTVTKKVMEMYVDAVLEDSDADRKGLGTGDQIISIDRKPVSDYDATFSTGSELRRLLVGRKDGDEVTLEIRSLGAAKPKTVTIVRRSSRQVPLFRVVDPFASTELGK